MQNIKGKNALLTGGSRGLGPYIARTLAQQGVNIALTARSKDGLQSAAQSLSQFNVQAKIYPADITDHASRKKLCEEVQADFGRIDLLINNAGMEWVSAYKDTGEIIVNTSPVRPMMFLDAIHPGIMSWVLRNFGVHDFYRRQSEDNEKARREAGAS